MKQTFGLILVMLVALGTARAANLGAVPATNTVASTAKLVLVAPDGTWTWGVIPSDLVAALASPSVVGTPVLTNGAVNVLLYYVRAAQVPGSTNSAILVTDTNGLPSFEVTSNAVVRLSTNGLSFTNINGVTYVGASNKLVAKITGASQVFEIVSTATFNSIGLTRLVNIIVGNIGNSTLASVGLINIQNTTSEPYELKSGASTTATNVFQFNGIPASGAKKLISFLSNSNAVVSIGTNGGMNFGPSSATNITAGEAGFFAATNTATLEMMAYDGAGNITQISSHPLDAPDVFFIVTNWVSGVPEIGKTIKLYSGVVEWQNRSLEALKSKWEFDRDLGATNFFATLTAGQKLILRAAMHRVESFAAYNSRNGFTNGHPQFLTRWDWAAVQNQFQADYDAARVSELAAFNAGYTNAIVFTNADFTLGTNFQVWPRNSNVTVRAVADIRQPKPALVDWVSP